MVDRRLPVVIGKLRGSRHSVPADRPLRGAQHVRSDPPRLGGTVDGVRTPSAVVGRHTTRPTSLRDVNRATRIRRVVRKRVCGRRPLRSAQMSIKNPAARVRHAQPTLSARRGRFSNPTVFGIQGLRLVKWAGSGFWMLFGRLFVPGGREVPPGRGTGAPNRGFRANSAARGSGQEMRATGFEPARVTPRDPKSRASANSATPAATLGLDLGLSTRLPALTTDRRQNCRW